GPGRSPFVLPIPPKVYTPEFSGLNDKTVLRGKSLEMQVTAVGVDPQKGAVRYELVESEVKALKMDAETGRLQWEPAKTDAAGRYAAQVFVYQQKGEKPILKGDFIITLKEVNREPVLTEIKGRSVLIGNSLEFLAKATDPDPDDQLTFSLKDAPDGASIDPSTGAFTWTPTEATETKEHTLEVVVTDGGKLSSSQFVTINVLEDKRRYTYFIGVVTENGEREAWLYDVSTRKETKLKEGTPFDIAGVSGFVFVIGRDFFEYQSNGSTYRLALGKSLRDPQLLAAPGKTAARPPMAKKPVVTQAADKKKTIQ
ncbi:MAG: cadherin repeat domain-containing protein, partial [Planctomycetes bacterium]|nr:cadherin repeat domain-containing protein [Planctomycetota bacterium]